MKKWGKYNFHHPPKPLQIIKSEGETCVLCKCIFLWTSLWQIKIFYLAFYVLGLILFLERFITEIRIFLSKHWDMATNFPSSPFPPRRHSCLYPPTRISTCCFRYQCIAIFSGLPFISLLCLMVSCFFDLCFVSCGLLLSVA